MYICSYGSRVVQDYGKQVRGQLYHHQYHHHQAKAVNVSTLKYVI